MRHPVRNNISIRTLSLITITLLAFASITACGPAKRPASGSPTNSNNKQEDSDSNNNGGKTAEQLPKEEKPRCESLGTKITSIKNHELLVSLWSQYNGLLQGFIDKSSKLEDATNSYCSSSKDETEYKKLTDAYLKAYIAYRKVSVYNLKELKALAPVLSTPLPLAISEIDAFASGSTFPSADNVILQKKSYEKKIGFAPFDYIIFGPNKDKLKSETSRCDYLKLNAEVISLAAKKLSAAMRSRVSVTLSKNSSDPENRKAKKQEVLDFLKTIYASLDSIVRSQQSLLQGSVTKDNLLNKLDAYYGKDSLEGIKATVESIRKIYEGSTTDRVNFEKRLCLSDSAKTDGKTGRAQKIHDDFRRIDLRLKALSETTLEDALLSSDASVKEKLTQLKDSIDTLKKALEVDFAVTVRLTEDGVDNDDD